MCIDMQSPSGFQGCDVVPLSVVQCVECRAVVGFDLYHSAEISQ